MTQLLAASAAKVPPAVSPPASIIPSPGPLPGPVNQTQILDIGQATYTLAAGDYLYADQLAIQVKAESPYGGGKIINRGTMWNDIATPGPILIRVVTGETVENYGLMVANADLFAGYDPNNRQHVVALTGNYVLNRGQIFALATNGNTIGVQSLGHSDDVVTNSGLIAVRAPEGDTVGVSMDGRLVNEAGGRILVEGTNAIAVQFKGALVPYDPDPVNGGYISADLITNAGTIQAVSTVPGFGSAALFIAHDSGDGPGVGYTAYVVNSGTIRADYAILTDNLAISTSVAHSVEFIRNLAGGLIEGDILLDRGQDTIENGGTMRGYVSMGEGNDLFDTRGGTLDGFADLFWGDDIFLGGTGADVAGGDSGNDRIEGNGGDDLLLGGGNDDVLIGGGGNDGLFGEYGNDRIVAQSGDFVWGGDGDDRVELGDYRFELVDGNAGFDTLVLPSGERVLDLSLALADEAIAGFEAMVLGGGKELVVRAADIPLISNGGSTLRLTGLATDRIDLVGAWVAKGTESIDGVSWRRFDLDGSSVLVEGSATVAVAGTGPAGATGLDPFAGGTPAPVPGDESGVNFTPNDFYLRGYRVAEAIVCNPEELWWNDGGSLEPVLYMQDIGCAVTNYGTIASISETNYFVLTAIQGLSMGTLTNFGTIAAVWTWDGEVRPDQEEFAGFITGTHHILTIVNNGLISAEAQHGQVIAAVLPDGLTNNGEIYARSEHGIAVGVYEPSLFVNHGSVLAIGGLAASGVRTRAAFDNEGRIEAQMTTPGTAESIGIELYFDSNPNVRNVTNSGTVIADIAVGQPVDMNYSGYGAVNLVNFGLLDGRVELGLVNDRVTNSGTITGAIRLFDGDDIFDGHAGRQADVHGGLGNDRLTGGSGGDLLFGDEGNDILQAGGGNDRLAGGSGADTFVFTAAADSHGYALRSDGAKLMPDMIADFTNGQDKIDLGAIDAIAGTAANDAFTFLGTGAFTHQAGQVRYETAGGFTSIYADVNGDGAADIQIVLQTPVTLTAADFVL